MSLRRLSCLSPRYYYTTWSNILPASEKKESQGTWVERIVNRQKNNQSGVSTPGEGQSAPEAGGSGSDGDPRPPQEVESLKKKLAKAEEMLTNKEKEMMEMKDNYLRALAEVENTRKRMERQIKDAKLFAIQNFSKDILNVADILEKAMESVPQSDLKEGVNPPLLSLFTGLKMTETELQKVFGRNGLVRMDPIGQLFNPDYHQALFEVPGKVPGTVGEVSKVGYTLNGRTIRPAMVGVVRQQEATESGKNGTDEKN